MIDYATAFWALGRHAYAVHQSFYNLLSRIIAACVEIVI